MPKSALYWGLAWGIIESTLGFFLHLLPVNIGFLIWTPAAFCCMHGAYRETTSAYAVMLCALVAAACKLTNLLLPVRIDTVLNPSMSILLEGIAFAAAVHFAGSRSKWTLVLCFNTFWRIGYLAYLLLAPAWVREISALASPSDLARFVIAENLATSAIITTALSVSAVGVGERVGAADKT